MNKPFETRCVMKCRIKEIFCRLVIPFEILRFGFRFCDASQVVDVIYILERVAQHALVVKIAVDILDREILEPNKI